jgi:hypothetical protein
MKSKIFVLTFVALALIAGVATAQDGGNGTNVNVDVANQTDDGCSSPRTIDNITQLCSAKLSSDGNRATLVVKSKLPQRITLTDAGGFMQEGTIRQRTFPLQPGKNTVTLRVTQVDGFAGVSVATSETLYAVPLDRKSSLIAGPFTGSDVQISALGGAASVALSMIVITIRTLTGKRDSAQRVA